MSTLDSRLNAFRADLADIRLKGTVEAARFTEGDIRQLTAPIAAIHREPLVTSMQLTQALMGERCRVFDAHEGWAWVQLEADGYVGYVVEEALTAQVIEPTHRVSVPSTFIFPAANIKAQPVIQITLNCRLAVTGIEGKFARLAGGGFVFAAHLEQLKPPPGDFVAIAELFRSVPYLWGGKSVAGLDCSGLVQLSLEAAGIACPRDTDMQEKALGRALNIDDLGGLRRGDLVFWPGHVGIMTDGDSLLHANAHFLQVTLEPLRNAIARIKANDSQVSAVRRLQ
jgi:cell wall-associated NlpC family hydrolase